MVTVPVDNSPSWRYKIVYTVTGVTPFTMSQLIKDSLVYWIILNWLSTQNRWFYESMKKVIEWHGL
jgi:hypothetical protein